MQHAVRDLTMPASPVPVVLPLPRTATSPTSEPVPRPEHTAHPTSPVGRLNTALAADPDANHPLRRLADRLGRPLLDLATCSDGELHAITDLLLEEKHRRNTRWYGMRPA